MFPSRLNAVRCVRTAFCKFSRCLGRALVLIPLVFGLTSPLSLRSAVLDVWRASDLNATLDDGDSVASWASTNGITLSSGTFSLRPRLYKNVTPSGGSVVRFDEDRLRNTTDSPVAGRTSFSIAVVFRLNGAGAGTQSQWYNNTGLVDAEQGGTTADWGTSVASDGRIGWGLGSPDETLYLTTTPSLVDTNFHAAVFTWGGGEQVIYLDNQYSATRVNSSSQPRNNAGVAFGRLLTDANQALIGELVEVRFYDNKLSAGEASSVIQELKNAHINDDTPTINTFTASPGQINIDQPATLSWDVTNATSVSIQPAVGTVGSQGSLQVYPRTNTTYTLTASNASGIKTRQATVLVDQLPPTANNQSVSTHMNQTRAIVLTGSDPQGSNLTYTVITQPAHGSLSGTAPNLSYTPAFNFIGNDQFTFRVNDGEFNSASAIVSIQVLPAGQPPSNIIISTTNISTSAHPGSFIASFRAVDPDSVDSHTFTLVPGFGNNSAFTMSGSVLLASDAFGGTNFSIRVRATDSADLWVEKTFQLSVTTNAGAIVINEFHYNPDDNALLEEFIELYNPTASAVDLSGWELSGAVDFEFPTGTVIGGNQYLVIAQDPATMQARYGVTAVGPWEGGLGSEGEEITLEDANGKKIDEVEYRAEFPWPVAADGGGASAALTNPELDNDLGSSWRSAIPPTPGAQNNVFENNSAPNIRQVNHTPKSPTSTNDIVITAKVTDPQGVASVQLQYQIVTPGNYLPGTLPVPHGDLVSKVSLEPTLNPAYTNAANWNTLVMTDNGAGGDATAGDDIYSVVLPAQANRVLVRYRITVTDSLGASRRAPFEDDPSLNFGCYVYDGIPDYQGTSSTNLQTLPVYTLISREQDVIECTAYFTSYQIPQFDGNYAHPARYVFNWAGTLVYDGVVYDHIHYRLRGANGRYQPGKRNWRFKFNRGSYFESRDQFGKKFPRKWSHLTTGKGSNNRLGLTFGLNEVVNYYLWNKAGVPAPNTLFFHFRVVDGAQEAPGQYNGDFWGLNWAQEDYDGAYLDSHDLAKGNVYKLINAPFSSNLAQDMVEQRRYLAANAVTNGMDGAAIQNGLLSNQSSDWIRARVNCDEWYRYHAVCEAVRHYDFWPSANKNCAWYFEPPYTASNGYYGRLVTLPWDTDSSWGATWNSGQDLVYNGIFLAGSHPDLALEYQNTVRELRDLLFQPDQVNSIIDALGARVASFVPADLARWSNAPSTSGNYSSLVSSSGFATPAYTAGIQGQMQDMKEFMFTGGTHAWWIDRQLVGAGGWITRLDALAADSNAPRRPTIYYVGQSNYPMNSLTFECLPYFDAQGPNTFTAMEWRLAEVQNTNQPPADPRVVPPLEIDAIWTSGKLTTWSNRITIPGVVVTTNRTYRVRLRHEDDTGRWSRWSEPVEFSVTPVDVISVLRQNLRFTEIMYHPLPFGAYSSEDLEFLEIQNIGGTPLSLDGLTFTAGITFTFANGTTLQPGQRFLLGRNATALQARYPGLTVNGIYSGKLDNAGETVRLSTPTGVSILEVTYKDSSPWPVTADGMGWSLVLADPVSGKYRSSTALGGSPAQEDAPSTVAPIVITELLTHTDLPQLDTIELHNPTASAVNVGGWFLTDDRDAPKKFRIPNNTILGAGAFVTFNQNQYNTNGLDLNLSSLGDKAYLFSGDATTNLSGYVHEVPFGAAANGVSLGRVVNSVGMEDFVAQSALTLGTNNAAPKIGPIVVTEIMFRPPLLETNENFDAEFIELQNVATTNVPLYDPAYPTNAWKLGNAVSYVFPTNLTLAAGERLLIVGFDPITNTTALDAFRTTYTLGTNTPIFGPWSGHLDNGGESIELKFPDTPELDGTVPYVMCEKVSYESVAPWPTSASGTGHSLQRITLLEYANDPTNWFAGPATPGALGSQTGQDTDGDGMPDAWEILNGTNPYVADGHEDDDADGFSNYAEYRAKTDPQDPQSYLKLTAEVAGSGTISLHLEAAADCSYTIQSAPVPNAAIWFPVSHIAASPTNHTIDLIVPATGSQFYRAVTPALE